MPRNFKMNASEMKMEPDLFPCLIKTCGEDKPRSSGLEDWGGVGKIAEAPL